MKSQSWRGVILLGALTILWGSNWPAMKLALRELDPWTFRTVCLLVGGGGLLALVRAGGHSLRVPRAERWPLALIALFNITGWHICSAYGLTLVHAGRAAIIAYTMPLWTVIFGRLLIGERITRSRLAALGLGLAGMAVLVTPDLGAIWAAPGRRPPGSRRGRVLGDRNRADQGTPLDDPHGGPDRLAAPPGRRADRARRRDPVVGTPAARPSLGQAACRPPLSLARPTPRSWA